MDRAQRVWAFALLGICISACSLFSSLASKPTPTPAPTETSTRTAASAPSEGPGEGGNTPSNWKGIPIMPGATDGADDGESYSYYVTATLSEVESFYSAQMPPLGWTFVSRDDSLEGWLYLTYQRGSEVVVVGALELEKGGRCFVVIAIS
jgi:hypothetical protein